MLFLTSLIFYLLAHLHPTVRCLEVLNTDYLNPWHEAKVDFDLRVKSHLGQKDFPEIWQRELMAQTALSRLEAARVLSIESGYGNQTWLRFRSSGIYEALLNMLRITDFQMYTRSYPNAYSMWGLEKSLVSYGNAKVQKVTPEGQVIKGDRYVTYRAACRGYPFDPLEHSIMAQTPMAYLMAMKWAVDLKGQVTFHTKPFYEINETVEAYTKLRDPTSYWLGGIEEGQRLFRNKVVHSGLPRCYREINMAIAFDSYGFLAPSIAALNALLRDLSDHLPLAVITIRGTSGLSGGYKEGAVMTGTPALKEKPYLRFFEILDLVERSIATLKRNIEVDDISRANVILVIGTFRDREPNVERAKSLWEKMQALNIEPYYASPGVGTNDTDLMPLLNEESFRGVFSWSKEVETMRLLTLRLSRLFCQAVVSLSESAPRVFNLFSRGTNGLFKRIHIRIPPRPKNERGYFDVTFQCISSTCNFDVYGHLQRHVNEYFHDTHVKVALTAQQVQKADFFSDSWYFIQNIPPDEEQEKNENPPRVDILPATHLVVVSSTDNRFIVRLLPGPGK